MRLCLSFAAALFALGVGHAQANDARCKPNPTNTVADFETAKDAMLRGEYDRFYEVVTPFVQNREARKAELLEPLRRAFPNGFRECASVVFRKQKPALFQEVILFDTGAGPLGLYLQGAQFRGDIKIIHFAYSDTPSDMIEKLK